MLTNGQRIIILTSKLSHDLTGAESVFAIHLWNVE